MTMDITTGAVNSTFTFFHAKAMKHNLGKEVLLRPFYALNREIKAATGQSEDFREPLKVHCKSAGEYFCKFEVTAKTNVRFTDRIDRQTDIEADT